MGQGEGVWGACTRPQLLHAQVGRPAKGVALVDIEKGCSDREESEVSLCAGAATVEAKVWELGRASQGAMAAGHPSSARPPCAHNRAILKLWSPVLNFP